MTKHDVAHVAHKIGIKPYIVNTGTYEREVYACCPCGWIGKSYSVRRAGYWLAGRDAERHYTDCKGLK